jgi:hypothetical protein
MSMIEKMKIVWRWRNLLPQMVDDYRVHKRLATLKPPLVRRIIEQQRLLWSNRIRAVDYYNLGLFDPSVTPKSKRDYIGRYEIYRIFTKFNPQEHHHLTNKKMHFNAFARAAQLPTTEILAIVTSRDSEFSGPVLRTEEQLETWMQENAIEDVVLKPVAGTKGWGILSLGARAADEQRWRKLPGREFASVQEIWTHCNRYLPHGGVLIERRLAPHPTLASLMPDVLHTVRVVTYLDGEPTILDAALRVGLGKGPADNMAQGGIVVPIDLDTGTCGQGVILINDIPHSIDEHPVTGGRITGLTLPYWPEVCDIARKAAEAFSMQKSIGWDVALTTRGPVLLEGNWCYDFLVNQIARRTGILATPWRKAFNKVGAYQCLGLGFVNHRR